MCREFRSNPKILQTFKRIKLEDFVNAADFDKNKIGYVVVENGGVEISKILL